MSVHPIEFRYGRDEVRALFDEENKLQRMLDVEAALVRAHAGVGNIPKKDADKVSSKAKTSIVTVERVTEIENEIHHDIMAVVKALSEQCGDAGRWVHLGATSNDIIDTATALQLKDYVAFLEEDLLGLKKVLVKQAGENKKLVCVGRTHGQHAIPTTYGLKFAIWASEVQRHIDRLSEIKPRILVGQMTGAVGTQAAFGDKGVVIQAAVMEDLGLESVDVSNQIVQRDRYAEFMLFLSLVAQSLNKFALEIRNLQRTEIAEVSEGFAKKQVGSSTMPHKMNPIYTERICGLSRVVKADGVASLDNVPLWHERDLTNSSCERILIPEACILLDYLFQLSIDVLGNLVFHEENIRRNLDMTGGRIMAESVMIALTGKGLGRQDAHALVRECALASFHGKRGFRELLLENDEVRGYMSEKEIDAALTFENYIGTAVAQVDALVSKIR